MVAHAQPRIVSMLTEASFGGTVADWDASGTETFVVEPDTSGVGQESLMNENYRQGVLRGHPMVLGLKNTEAAFSQYITGTGTNAAANAQGVASQLALNLKCSLGGLALGYASGIASNSGATLSLDAGHGTNQTIGQFIFAYDVSASTGYFYRIENISTDDLTLDRTLEFTAAGTDRTYAVLQAFMDEDSLTNFGDANHISRAFFFKGADSEDKVELLGCKMAAEISGIASGEMPMAAFTISAATFNIGADAPSPTLGDAPQGMPPLVVGADVSRVYIAPFGDPLAALDCTFTVEPTVGIAWEKVPAVNGTEGICGYVATGFDDIALKVTIPWDDAYSTGYRNLSEYHMLVQIGDQPSESGAMMLYFPRMQIKTEPKRGDHTGLTSVEIEFKCLYNSASTALTGDNLELWRSPMVVGVVA